jgi:hypothetical protein
MSRILGPDEVTRLQALQAFFAPDATAKRVEDFGKWVFSAVATVGTLGTGFAVFGSSSLNDRSRLVYAVAMLFVGISLACAVMVLTPAFLKINPNSLQSLNFEFSRSIKNRRGWTISAGVFLVFAFIAAGIVPACSIKFSPPPAQFPGLSYTFESSKLTIRLVLKDLKPGSDASIDVTKVMTDANKVDHTLTVFEDQLRADANGKLERNIVLDKTATDPITIQYKVVGKDGKTIEASKQLHLAAS